MSSVAPEKPTQRKGRAPKAPPPVNKVHLGKRAVAAAEASDRVWKYFKADGTTHADNPLFSIHEYLASNDDYSAVSWQQFKRDIGIDLTDPRNSDLLDSLSRNPVIKVTWDASGAPILACQQELGVKCSQDLRHLFESRLPRGLPTAGRNTTALGVTEDQLAGAFPGVEMEVDDMVASGRVACVVSKKPGTNREGRVFFPSPPGVQAPAFLRDMWNDTKLPCESNVKSYLLQKGLRTQRDYAERDQHKKQRREAERKAVQEALEKEKEAKKDERVRLQIEKWRQDFTKRNSAA